jgi:RecB family exonuclease
VDIEFEGDKEFFVNITAPIGLDRIDISPAARVVIIDYNGEC